MTSAKTVEEEAEAKLFKENAAKDKQLPLHYAAEKGASLNLMKLLLKANPKAATAQDKARRTLHMTRRPRCRRSSACNFALPLPLSSRAVYTAPLCASRRISSYPCTTPLPRARRSR